MKTVPRGLVRYYSNVFCRGFKSCRAYSFREFYRDSLARQTANIKCTPRLHHQAGQDEALVTLFESADREGLVLKGVSYTWAVVALKRSGRTKDALDTATNFSSRGIKVTINFILFKTKQKLCVHFSLKHAPKTLLFFC